LHVMLSMKFMPPASCWPKKAVPLLLDRQP
jgi:hypothetical protein